IRITYRVPTIVVGEVRIIVFEALWRRGGGHRHRYRPCLCCAASILDRVLEVVRPGEATVGFVCYGTVAVVRGGAVRGLGHACHRKRWRAAILIVGDNIDFHRLIFGGGRRVGIRGRRSATRYAVFATLNGVGS